MRRRLIGISLAAMTLAGVGAARAEVAAEAIPGDFIAQFAPLAVQLIQQQFPNPAVKVDPATDKAQGFHVKEMVGLVLMPDKNLTAKGIDEQGDKELPVGVLATKSLSLEDKDVVLAADKIAVADFNGMFKIPVFFLAVKAKGADRTLEVYGKDGKALASVPLKKQAGDAASLLTVKLTNIDLEKRKMDAVFSLAGAYEGTLKLGFLEI
jgi:hypothetical protein